MSDRVGVMYLGSLVEESTKEEFYANPLHPYTKALLSALPEWDIYRKQERIILKGDVPSPSNPPPCCCFHTRCPQVMDICKKEKPILREHSCNEFK